MTTESSLVKMVQQYCLVLISMSYKYRTHVTLFSWTRATVACRLVARLGLGLRLESIMVGLVMRMHLYYYPLSLSLGLFRRPQTCTIAAKAEDTRGRKRAPIFGTCVMRKRLRLSTPVRTVFYSEDDFRKHVIDRNSCDSLKFIVYVRLVCIQFSIGVNIFLLRFLLILFWFATMEMNNATATALLSCLSAMSVGVKNRRRFSTPCVFSL